MKKKKNKKNNVKEILDNIESKKGPVEEYDVEYDENVKESVTLEDEENVEVEETPDIEEIETEEQPERKDKVMDVLIAVFATFIIMFTTFGALKVSSALKSATILNNAAETTSESNTEESTEDDKDEEHTREEVTTFRNEFVTTQHTTEEESEEKTTKKEKETKDDKKEEETEAETSKEDSKKKAQELLNSLSLSSSTTGYGLLDSKAYGIVSGIKGSQYEQLMGIYSYIVNSITIGSGDTNSDIVYKMLGDLEYESEFDAFRVFEAYQALNSLNADAEGYASAFMVLARAAGFDAYYVSGSSYKLQSSKHAWVIITIKSVDYIFDPYTDAKVGNTQDSYEYFCKTMKSLNGTYVYADKAGDKSSFMHFRTIPAMTLNVDYGELTTACKWIPSVNKTPCTSNFDTLISVEAEKPMEITANVPENSISEWNVLVINNATNERIQLECTMKDGGISCVWTPTVAGNYRMTVAATDSVGRHCEVMSNIQVVGNKSLSGLAVTQKAYEDKLEAYMIEADAQDGIGDVQYDFKVYKVDENGTDVLVSKEWVEWNSLSSIIVKIPEGTKIGTKIKIKVTAVDEASNKAEQEITINTKGK
ncbi:MAG: transglutaminase domain-containing protein [Lachnospiraceae bacterium]|nr:transglutaminase domain-containing protein [Lachnospiraceae bacterium]